VYLENRPMDARTGFYVVTPLRLADGSVVLVQRGWLPRDLRDRTRLPDYRTPQGMVTVQGLIAPALARLYEFDAAASGPFRQNLSLDAFARETNLALRPWVLVQQDTDPAQAAPAAASPDGLLRQWPAPSTGVHKHQGYAFQWFSLSALTLVLYAWFQFIRPHRSRAR
jgi:surfeit locus 1 family protein